MTIVATNRVRGRTDTVLFPLGCLNATTTRHDRDSKDNRLALLDNAASAPANDLGRCRREGDPSIFIAPKTRKATQIALVSYCM